MMQASKILLSEEELNLAKNGDWILTKNRIMQKIISAFARLATAYQENILMLKNKIPEEVFEVSPKISRGEQHQGLPYVMLDYPRIFSRENILAIRTFFWWGNFFSLTLHIKGDYKTELETNVLNDFPLLAQKNFFIAVSDDEWRQDFERDNYQPFAGITRGELKNMLKKKDFLKLAVKWPLTSHHNIVPLLEEHHALLMRLVAG